MLEGSRPGRRHQPLSTGHRPRIGHAVGEIVAEIILLVSHDQHVVADALGEAGDLGLHGEMAGIGAARARHEGPGLILDDLDLEFLGRAAHRLGIGFVIVGLARDEQDMLPSLDREILHQRIGQHGPAGQEMQHAGPAIRPAQPVVGRRGIEQRQPFGLRQIGHLQQQVGRQIRDEIAIALADQILEPRDDAVGIGGGRLLEVIILMDEFSGRGIVGEREPCPLHALVIGRLVEIAQWKHPLHREGEIGDIDSCVGLRLAVLGMRGTRARERYEGGRHGDHGTARETSNRHRCLLTRWIMPSCGNRGQ